MVGRRRRPRAPGGRPLEFLVSFSLEEATWLRLAADRDGMAVGAWIGQASVRAARTGVMPASTPGETMQALMGVRAEVMEDRRLLRNIAGNVNDIARHANTIGTFPPTWTARALAQVDEASDRIVRLVQQLDELTAIARQKMRG